MEKKKPSYIKQIMRTNLQNLGLHSWVEQVRQKHKKIEVCVCVYVCVCVCVWLCTKAFFLSRIQRRISIECKIKGSGMK